MDSVQQIQDALSARSRTATLDQLRNEGRQRVRLIRAEHVAAMIAEAVHTAIEQSGLIAPEEAQGLVERSRAEFRSILAEREQEAAAAQAVAAALAERERELVELQAAQDQLAAALREAQAESYRLRAQLEAQQQAATAVAVEPTAATAAPAAPAVGSELLLALVQEMSSLKANLLNHQQAQPAAAGGGGGADFAAALDKLAGSLNDRLEKLGRKMGVSGAVDGDAPVDFSGMFKDAGSALESNMQNIEVKQKAGGGIAANLARLKKLKGGGS